MTYRQSHGELHFSIIPVSAEKHLKLLSQKPHTSMASLPGVAVKQAADGDTLWSNGSPRRIFNPMSVPDTHTRRQSIVITF